MIEHLPSELRDRFTEMREQDLSVQSKYTDFLNISKKTHFLLHKEYLKQVFIRIFYSFDAIIDRVDSLEERQKNFFSNCAKNKSKGSEKEDYDSIRKEYQKVRTMLPGHLTVKIALMSSYILIDPNCISRRTITWDHIFI